MTPVPVKNDKFGRDVVYAKDQSEYKQLPAAISKDEYGVVTTKWRLSPLERFTALFRGYIYLQQLTYNKPLQPIKMSVKVPRLDGSES